ncbi:hypothetical protein [Malonomonas rubra]|uniref:hypothetical protein n=1 Tax=Malonomonas rubra TaxID=57040 RepID=UPI0026E945DF|nr:hypothetical protein [Malonomonas rubra]
MAVERALFLSRWDGVLPDKYQRLYFGTEFCSWAFPPRRQIEAVLDAARTAGLSFTLVTPILREETLAELSALFTSLAKQLQPDDEVVISDFGTLHLVRELLPQIEVVLGRVLSGQKRGPRIEDLSLSSEALEYFRQGSWYSAEAVSLLQEQGIRRVELDNLLQGVAPLPKALCGTLHTPYAMVTSSRNCPFHQDCNGRRCSVACGEVFRLTTEETSHPLLQAGNSQFIRLGQLPQNLAELGIDRLVEHRQLPR